MHLVRLIPGVSPAKQVDRVVRTISVVSAVRTIDKRVENIVKMLINYYKVCNVYCCDQVEQYYSALAFENIENDT